MRSLLFLYSVFLFIRVEGQLLPFLDAKSCLWGYVDAKGKFEIKPQFDEAWPFFSSGKAIVGKWFKQKNQDPVLLYGIIDGKGQFLTKYKYKNIDERPSIRGYYGVSTPEGLGGFINDKGEEIIPLKYSGFRGYGGTDDLYFSGGFGIATNDAGKTVYVDSAGNELILKKEYHDLCRFSEGLAAVITSVSSAGYKIAFINTKGEEVIKDLYYGSTFTEFKDGLCLVYDEKENYGYIDRSGKLVIPFTKYWAVGDFSNGMAIVKESESRCGAIDKTGKLIVPFKYNGITPFKNGIAAASIKCGYLKDSVFIINKEGRILKRLECEKSNIDFINSDIDNICIKRNGKWAVLDTSGKLITPFISDNPLMPTWAFYGTTPKKYLSIFKGKSQYSLENLQGCFDRESGKQKVPIEFREILYQAPFLKVEKKSNQVGFYDSTGLKVVPCVFDEIRPFVNGYAVAISSNWKYNGCIKHFKGESREVGHYDYKAKTTSFIIDTKGKVLMLTEKGLEKVELKEDE